MPAIKCLLMLMLVTQSVEHSVGDAASAPLNGIWSMRVTTSQSGDTWPLAVLVVKGSRLSGKYSSSFGSSDITGTTNSSSFAFTVQLQNGNKPMIVRYIGSLDRDMISGSV